MAFWNRPVVDTEVVERKITEVVRELIGRALADTETMIDKLRTSFDLEKGIVELQEKLETLKIEKARKDEEFARKEREIEHKVGLERSRQKFEIEQAKREALVGVREENLAADKKRFEDQMTFHEKRFTEEVGYLKTMIGEVLERVPHADIKITRK